ncbi:MAG: dienelactone hydrolase family protein [Burkholderiales bacterium]
MMPIFFRNCRARAALSVALVLATGAPAVAADDAAQAAAVMNETVVPVPKPSAPGVKLETTIFRPDGRGPFPVAIINHGKAPGDPLFQARARYLAATHEFVRRGYAVVIPMRQGFAGSGGPYEGAGCDIVLNARRQADDVEAVVGWLRKQSWADTTRIVVLGQSHGGLTTLAFGTRETPGVRALINFAGGLRLNECPWRADLVSAFGTFGAGARVPSLWFYGENDSYFRPELVAGMYNAYTKAGGKAKLVAYGPFGDDAHRLFGSADGVEMWVPEVERFLQAAGLPSAARPPVARAP